MNAETEQNINQAIDWLQKTGGQIQDFTIQQAPVYCHEVVMWKFWAGVAGAGFGILALIAGIISSFKFFKWMKEDNGEPNGRTVPSMIIAILGIIYGSIGTATNIPKIIKAHFAPRLVIVEHLRGLK